MDPHYIDTSSKGNSKSKGSERSNPRKKVLPVRVPPAHRVGLWTLHICPTTGGNLELVIRCTETVDGLKKAVGKTLRIPKERINLLHKDRYISSQQDIRTKPIKMVVSYFFLQSPVYIIQRILNNDTEICFIPTLTFKLLYTNPVLLHITYTSPPPPE